MVEWFGLIAGALIGIVLALATAKGMDWWLHRWEDVLSVCSDPTCSSCSIIRSDQEAEKKAFKLFVSLLTPAQKKEMKEMGSIREKGSKTGRTYIINLRSLVSNIIVMQDDDYIVRLCIYMTSPNRGGGVPPSDHFIAQLLYVRYNEPSLLRKAISTY